MRGKEEKRGNAVFSSVYVFFFYFPAFFPPGWQFPSMRRSPSVSFGRGFDGRRVVHFIYSLSQSCGLPVGMGCTFTHLQFFFKKKNRAFFCIPCMAVALFCLLLFSKPFFSFLPWQKNRKRSRGRRKSGAEPLDPLLLPGPILSDSISVEPPLRSAAVGRRRGERERGRRSAGEGEGSRVVVPSYLSF